MSSRLLRLLRILLLPLVTALLPTPGRAAGGPCPGTATLTVFVDNQSTAPSIPVAVEGTLAADASTCDGAGAVTYQRTLTCTGSGLVRCDQVTGLAPGAWVHRQAVTVPGSAEQRQAQRLVLVGGSDASNVLVWTVYAKTFTVGDATADALQTTLASAAAWTAGHPGSALVTFAASAFPGAASPRRISLLPRSCATDARNVCTSDGKSTAGVCFNGSRIVVDALDANADPGGVILTVDTCRRNLLRLAGSDNVLRGLTLEGSRMPNPVPPCQADTLFITGATAKRNRIEQALVVGPSCGDALSAQNDAGDEGSDDNLVIDSRITGAHDKGVKVSLGAHLTVAQSCIHDNQNGGIQSTLGGHVAAIENVVQHNIPGHAENGLSVGNLSSNDPAGRSTLATDGNIVRFSGGDGLSLSDNGDASYRNDYVADNQFGGSKVETTPGGPAGAVPAARFHGVAFVCNRHENLTGTCNPSPAGDEEAPCTTVADCCADADGVVDPTCAAATQCRPDSFPRGFGAVVTQAPGHEVPDVSYGEAAEPGRNAFSSNKNAPAGANFSVREFSGTVSAEGNQWEHCGTGATCDVASVQTSDILADGSVSVGTPEGPRVGAPVLLATSPPRPRAGDVVRIFGENFNAIEGNPLVLGASMPTCSNLTTCTDQPCPTGPCVGGLCACAPDNPAVQSANRQTSANRIALRLTDGSALSPSPIYPDAVTPTMIAFRMPFDCFAPIVLEVTKHDPSGAPVATRLPRALCDPDGCAGAPAGAPCDDRNTCTLDDRCDGTGHCIGSNPRVCDRPCLACNPTLGCVPKPVSTPCDDGDACTAGDRCTADADCVSTHPVVCGGQCNLGTCDQVRGCIPKVAGAACSDGDACTVGDRCSGTGNFCVPGTPRVCTGACLVGCDPSRGCVPAPAGTVCRTAAGNCDFPETCNGTSAACPADAMKPASTVCRAAVGPCDLDERCTGTSVACPEDAERPAGSMCRAAAGPCDVAELCDGTSSSCPPDFFAAAGSVCRPAGDPCSEGDNCTGTGPTCPAGNRVKTDFEAVSCAFARSFRPPACVGLVLPLDAARFYQRASDAVGRAEHAGAAKRRRLFARARANLTRARAIIERAGHRKRKPLASECVGALRFVLSDAIDRL